jgi:hypothetical protein
MTLDQAKAWTLKHLTGSDEEIARALVALENTIRENMAVECDYQAEEEEVDGSPENASGARACARRIRSGAAAHS